MGEVNTETGLGDVEMKAVPRETEDFLAWVLLSGGPQGLNTVTFLPPTSSLPSQLPLARPNEKSEEKTGSEE